ncbi:MAG: YeeE/YedE thiosulfate transporter family protein [Enhygromyxa sp.]
MIEELPRLASGLMFGLVFGFLLQKGRVAKFEVIIGQLTLRDWTVAKVMMSAIIVGGLGIHALLPSGAVALDIKPLALGGVLLGGACFGVGLAVFGHCPGTSVAACGEGRRDAMIGVLGGLFGSGVYVLAYSAMQSVRAWRDYGELSLPSTTGLSPWVWFALAAVALLVLGRPWSPKAKGEDA